ncbi:hypothetical protein BC940DRAFT_302932 [Gongronella butleri]|nr:hypothetical protein BC940DRAFT_302932 [Gongronella butleri]
MTPTDTALTHHRDQSQHSFTLLPTPTSSPPRAMSPPLKEKKPQPKRSLIELLQRYISELEGRDKSIKIVQYAFKLLIYYQRVDAKRWSGMVSQFSQTRKLLRVGHWLGTVRDMQTTHGLWQWAVLWNTMGNEVADDIYCFYKMGTVDAKLGKRAEKVAIYCWFIGIWIDLHKSCLALQSIRGNDEQTQQKRLIARVSCAKLIMDGIFCSCDIWEPKHSAAIQAWAGFVSGCLSGFKLWRKINASN